MERFSKKFPGIVLIERTFIKQTIFYIYMFLKTILINELNQQ